MTIQPASLFTPRWEVFWGTTYSFELELFDEYLFRHLGDPPLNATVLVDFARLAHTWDSIREGEEWRIQRVNSLYLVRAAGRPQGRFHPKTYFFADAKGGTLLVGSGNLSLHGLEEGKEVFSRFDSSDANGLAAIVSWRDWIKGIVDETGDEMLIQRWFRLGQTTKDWLKGRRSSSAFVTNIEVSMLDQLLGKASSADEVHVTAPFFDSDVEALGTLLARSRPKKVCVYLGRGASVDGVALRKVLKSAKAEASVFSFDPPRFVHAKLVAIIKGAKARILSGSANLSRAALTSTLSGQAWANVEAGVLTEVTAEAARALFRPPDMEPVPVALDDLAGFVLVVDEDVPPLPLRLFSARPDSDGRIEVTFEGSASSDIFLNSRSGPMALNGSRTVDVFALDPTDVLVWLSDQTGERISNRVPLDDPAALHRQLETPSNRASDRPREFDSSDLQNPVVQILARLNSEYIFDLDELNSMAQAERANEDDTPEAEAGDFWERLAREELQLDPRAGAYRRFGGETPFEGDDVLLLLRMMLDRTPEERHAAIGTTDPTTGDEEHHGTPWTMTQRLQVRLMNVLTRWARGLADPRMNWLQPFAAVRNFEVLLYALAELWELAALPEPKLKRALALILGNFVRSEDADGYMDQLGDPDRGEAIGRLSPEACAVASALTYLGLQSKTKWGDDVFEWQAWLKPCLDDRIIGGTDEAAALASRIGKEVITAQALATRLVWAASYIDDPHWCLRMKKSCGLEDVSFSRKKFAYELVLEVRAELDLVDAPGVVKLIRAALDFRRADGLVIMSGPERISVRLGERCYARLRDRQDLESSQAVTESSLAELERAGLPLRERLAALDEEASAS